MRSVYELLETSEQLISNGWVPYHEAVDQDNKPVDPWSDYACKWCVLGSVRAVTHFECEDEARYTKFIMSIINMANSGVMAYNSIPDRNDHTSQEIAVSMVSRAKNYVQSHFGENYVPNWLKSLVKQ